ncbi:hypothetical protein Ddye_024467 [Dipteronia dyeriana]|uniref:Uncharacterized protein n=1 Tax=Dipteronia dyeriana TaxID=168575 RepID=A0AAD9WSZ9_9ROSI|nr:hypothetical protein Ddye_024467 [Dipteronia dyeriana]
MLNWLWECLIQPSADHHLVLIFFLFFGSDYFTLLLPKLSPYSMEYKPKIFKTTVDERDGALETSLKLGEEVQEANSSVGGGNKSGHTNKSGPPSQWSPPLRWSSCSIFFFNNLENRMERIWIDDVCCSCVGESGSGKSTVKAHTL